MGKVTAKFQKCGMMIQTCYKDLLKSVKSVRIPKHVSPNPIFSTVLPSFSTKVI